jgi:repressor LexA
MTIDLTKRQKEIFEFIRRYLRKYGYPPTVREIGSAIGLHSPSTVHAHLAKLEQIGLLRRDPSKPRAIEIMVGKARQALKGPGIPVVGNVAAGEPILADENIDDYVQVPSTIGGEGGDYILQVRGDSMVNAGILDGDFVVVRPAKQASNGEIVVALLGDEATVKRYFRERNAIRLQPENDDHEPIRTQDAELLGKVIGVFRTV